MKSSYILLLFLFIGGREPFPIVTEAVSALPMEVATTEESVAFITGFDEGDTTYYAKAREYFETRNIPVITHLFSLEEIVLWLNQNSNKQKRFDEIHIVSHGNPWLGMSLKTNKFGERTSVKTLGSALATGKIPKVRNTITACTKIIFHSCGLGENRALMQELKQVFTAEEAPKVYASSFFNIFGGKYAAHYLAKPYYGYYPTAESPGPRALSETFKANYPHVDIDWFTALKTRQEHRFGKAYSYKFNIPVDWEFTFDAGTEISGFETREVLMDWLVENEAVAEALFQLGIPIEKYRWKSFVEGRILYVKGKTTVLCIMQPVMEVKDPSEYRTLHLNDTELYQIL
ncbi:hypothetical protein WIW50_19430 [Flavobacteriaceae bacterium 3-367]|uniref:hypothetical protein n=1 Tax=Eudoraea algarum TaxID=3417568 RepID=UPI00327D4C43